MDGWMGGGTEMSPGFYLKSRIEEKEGEAHSI
jgi:hypothetical protein